ncbi:MAG: trimethylamine methyltransferase family protein [Dehalococcoidia bacterium]|nr:trimethylamine methyltransferase family protein [Dehalococcoidia bacterium]
MILGTKAGYSQLSGCSLNLFTDSELAEIHRATLDVLQNSGILVMNDEAREIFYSHGCEVDKKTNIVKIPPYLVEEAIRSAPSRLLLAARNPKYDTILESNRVAYTCFGVAIEILDSETGKVRETTNKDLAETAILADAAESLDVYSMAVTPRDVPSEVEDLTGAETSFINCSKHFHHIDVLTTDGVRAFFEMAAAISGGAEQMKKRPICSILICPVSPMQLSPECCEVIIESARLGIPCNVLSEALSGGTAPVTTAGTLLTHNAEVLGGITLSQLTKKGAPVIYGSSTTMLDLTYVNAPVGAPELGMISAAVAKLAQYYNLPSYVSGT